MFKRLKKKTRAVFLIGILLTLGAWAQGQGYLAFDINSALFMAGNSSEASLKDFQFEKAARRDMRQTVLATGTVSLKSGAEVKVGSRISGQLQDLFVRIGDFVRAGQVIAVVEHEDLIARVAQRQADLRAEQVKLEKIREEGPLEIGMTEANLEEYQVQLRLAGKMLKRNQNLNRQGIVSAMALDQAEETLESLQAKIRMTRKDIQLKQTRMEQDIKLARVHVQKARANLLEEKTQLSYATIRATIDGVVASISTQRGETVAAGMSAPVFVNLIDLSKLEVTVFVDETDIGRVRLGQEAVFMVDSYPDKVLKGVIGGIHPMAVIKDNVVNYEVILGIDRSSVNLLRPEMTANVVITTEKKSRVLTVPKQAIKRKGKEEYVVVNRGGELAEILIDTGWRDSGYLEVLSGLKEGDLVGVPVKPKLEGRG